jgi:hypothetical protein
MGANIRKMAGEHCFSGTQITIHEPQKKEGRRPLLSSDWVVGGRRMQSLPFQKYISSGGWQVHVAFRCGQLRPQRKNHYSLTGLILQRVQV